MLYAAVKTIILLSKFLPINNNNYVQYTRQRFGPITAKNVFWYVKLQIKQEKLRKDIKFLRTCKREQLTPTFVRIKIPATHQHYKRAIHNFRMQLIQEEIKIKKRKLTENYKVCKNLMSLLKKEITGLTLMRVCGVCREITKKKSVKWDSIHTRKITTLRKKKVTHPQQTTQLSKVRNIITNLSDRKLSHDEISALKYGLGFVHPPTKFDDRTFISNIEAYFVNLLGYTTEKRDYDEKDENEPTNYHLTPTQLEYASKIRSICNNFRRTATKTIKNQSQQIQQIISTLKTLSQDKTILITRPDKGRGIVILNRDDYIHKVNKILSDGTTFEVTQQETTIKQENQLNSKLLELKNEGFITPEEYNYARSRGAQPARLYGLPKIHKKLDTDGIIPIRPIVSSSKTFNYRLAKLLANKLKHLPQDQYAVKDSFAFVDWLHKLEINPQEYKMLSFDITALFTKVPTDRTIEIILERLYGHKHTCFVSKQPKESWCSQCKRRQHMKCLLEIATKQTQFRFNDKTYRQRNGIAMGSPLGPLFADVYVSYLESRYMKRIRENGVQHYKRFVDDTFTLVHKNTEKDKIVDILNSYDNQIQFTCEEEKDEMISFLDVRIKRNQQQSTPFTTSIHRKETFTGLLINWSSYVPKTYKVSALSSMVYRSIKICSTFELMTNEFESIRQLAAENDYPKNLTESIIRTTLNRYYERKTNTKVKPNTNDDDHKKVEQLYVNIPYFSKATERFGKQLIKIASSIRPQLHVQPIARPPPSVSQFFPTKDKVPTQLQSNVVYRITCSDCSASYIGKTTRQLERRIHEHSKNITNNNKPNSYPSTATNTRHILDRPKRLVKPIQRYGTISASYDYERSDRRQTNQPKAHKSALGKHADDQQHCIDWHNAKILDKDTNDYRLKIRESLAIKQHNPTLNRTVNSVPLLVFPEGIRFYKPTVKMKQNSGQTHNSSTMTL